MRYLIVLFVFVMFSCANHSKNLNGNWQQIFLGYEDSDDNKGFISDSATIALQLSKQSTIKFDYNDGLDLDNADSIHFNYPQLNFRKLNYNKTYNRYQMKYNETCDCFDGIFKSFSGNKVKVKWVRK